MRFPVKLKHRKAEATIYGKSEAYPFYRLAYRAAGKRILRSFSTYSDARQEAEAKVRELAQGSQSVALSAKEAADALAIREALAQFHRDTGRSVSGVEAVIAYLDASRRLGDRPLSDAVRGYLATVVTVRRVNVNEAVCEYLASRQPLTVPGPKGGRAQLSRKYLDNQAKVLRRFADTFPNTALSDLTREHLDKFIGSLANFEPKTRNHHRAAARQLLEWATRKDYLAVTHRLLDADGMRSERANGGEITFYTPNEFRALLQMAEGPLRALVAVGGLAGLRVAELLRLDWSDLWRVPNHIEITAGKAKTRSRRLVEVGAALNAWLDPDRAKNAGPIWPESEQCLQRALTDLHAKAGIHRKANGLRHAFITYAFALDQNENKAAALAGTSPAMIFAHYRGLATKAEAEKWFAVTPGAPGNVVLLSKATAANR